MTKEFWRGMTFFAFLFLTMLLGVFVFDIVEDKSLSLGKDYYVATTGSDNNPGTLAQPFATWGKGIALATPGDVVWIRGGVYYASQVTSGAYAYALRISNKDGTAKDTIKIFAYQNEKPILDCSKFTHANTRFGAWVSGCDYVHFRGLSVRNLTEYNTYYYGVPWETVNSNNILYENCTVSNSSGGWTCEGTSGNVRWLNCDVYAINDKVDAGGYANGFSSNIDPGKQIEYVNCRAWDCSDDGFDFYGSAGYITVKGCWAFENGTGTFGNGNGCGIKVGANKQPKEAGIQRTITNNLVWNNTLLAFDESLDASSGGQEMEHLWANNTSFNNLELHNFQTAAPPLRVFRNNISLNDKYKYPFGAGLTVDHNSWNNVTCTVDDFITVNPEGTKGDRAPDGSLPVTDFMRLKQGSDLVDAGVNVGLPFLGKSPDIGAFEVVPYVPPVEPPVIDTVIIVVPTTDTLKFIKNDLEVTVIIKTK